MDNNKRTIERFFILLIDIGAITLSLAIAYYIRYRRIFHTDGNADQTWVFVLFTVIYVVVFFIVGNHSHFFRRGYLAELYEVCKSVLITVMLFLLLLYMMKVSDDVSRLMFGYFTIIWIGVMYLMRIIFKNYMVKVYQKSSFSSHLILIVDAADAARVIENIVSYNEWNREISGVILTDEPPAGYDCVSGVPVVGRWPDLIPYAIRNNVDEVFFFESSVVQPDKLQEAISQLKAMGVTVNVNIEEFSLTHSGKRDLGRVGKYAVVTFDRNAFTVQGMMAKRILDIIGSLVGMAILGVAAVFLAPAIRLDSPGPVFFGQTRVGRNGRKFTCYKFRSMYVDAEQRKAELMKNNEMQGLMFKMEDDPRITKVGRFIRKTSLDELPQFWNIFKGDMSLVGTRPPTVDEYEQYEARHKCRLSMTPGLTGMWQISGRSDITDFDEVVRLDMAYIDNWTISKDIKILLKTVGVVFTGKGSR